jgi:polygalacturonase
VTLVLEEGAELLGSGDLDAYEFFTPPRDTPLVGDRLQWHRALVLADGADNVAITGRGVINGNGIADPSGEDGIRGPHAVLLGNCSNVRISGITIRDAGNYNVLLEFCTRVDVRDVTITGGLDGVHLSGWTDRPCRDVTIRDCRFYTGDDCIAGWYWQTVRIDRCVLNTACNGIRLYGPRTT